MPTIEERLSGNSAWASGQIKAAGYGPIIALWLLAIVWNLTFGVSFVDSFSNATMKTGALIIIGIFAFLGIVPIFFAVRLTMQRLRFGNSWCSINGKAGVLGSEMSGKIRTKTKVEAIGDYTLELQCLESYSTGSGKDRRTVTKIHYEQKHVVPHAGQSAVAGIPFAFKLPNYPQETGYVLMSGSITWNLKISAPVKGVDYSAMFQIPVFQQHTD